MTAIKHLSPFRYPGGKEWFKPYVNDWARMCGPFDTFVDLFSGGCSIGLHVAQQKLASHVFLIERDPRIAAFFLTAFTEPQEIIDRIRRFDCTPRAAERVCNDTSTRAAIGFAAFLRNRINFGGLQHGGMLRWGYDGLGIQSCWYADTLIKRVKNLFALRDRITYLCVDAFDFLLNFQQSAHVFIDPPYPLSNRQLYTFNHIDHAKLFDTLAFRTDLDFLMTYNQDQTILDLIKQHGFKYKLVPMRTLRAEKRYELVIHRTFARGVAPCKS